MRCRATKVRPGTLPSTSGEPMYSDPTWLGTWPPGAVRLRCRIRPSGGLISSDFSRHVDRRAELAHLGFDRIWLHPKTRRSDQQRPNGSRSSGKPWGPLLKTSTQRSLTLYSEASSS